MTRLRSAAVGLVVAGLAAGSLSTGPPLHEPVRAGDYWILAADFHVHGFLGDGALAPWLLRDEAARAGLDVFVLTNHNRVSTGKFARRRFAGTAGPIVIPGQEITARGFHIAGSTGLYLFEARTSRQAGGDRKARGTTATIPVRVFSKKESSVIIQLK